MSIEQPSFQDHQLSIFTRKFVNAVKYHETEIVRYRNIMDYISDEFENKVDLNEQTPRFVTQVLNTEIFCSLNTDIKALVYPEAILPNNAPQEGAKTPSLKRIVEIEAKHFPTKEEAIAVLESLQKLLVDYSYSSELQDLYRIEPSILASVHNLPLRKAIGQWLIDNKHSYFAEARYRTEYKDPYWGIASSISRRDLGREEHQVLDGFDLTVEVPFKGFKAIASRKYLSIPAYYCSIIYLTSRSKLRFFYLYTDYIDKNWDEVILNGNAEWNSFETPFGDTELIQQVSNILKGFETFILSQLKVRFGLEDN